jgi:hypothetical protein
MQRVHLLKGDLEWLPPSYRALRVAVTGGIWTGIVGALAALSAFGHVHAWGAVGSFAAVSGYFGGDRAARAVLRGRLRKLASGAVDLRRLPAEADGELIHVTGKVHALGQSPEVYRRTVVTFDPQSRFVVEELEDFWLVGDGEPVRVEAADARLLADGKSIRVDGDAPRVRELETLARPLLARVVDQREKRRAKGKSLRTVFIAEYVLRDGDAIEVLGYKSRMIDPTVATRLERDTPFRATLRGGKNLPLLIAPRSA